MITKSKFTKLALGALLLQPGLVLTTFAQTQPNTEELLKRIEQLEHEVKSLRNGSTPEKSSESKKGTTIVTAGSNGIEFRSADTNFVLKIKGYVQADGRFFIDDHIPVNDSFLIRRARPIFEGTVFKKFDYKLMLDFGSGVTASASNDSYLQDAYMTAKLWPEFQIQAGKFKQAVGLERLQSGANLTFIERAYPTQLLPVRDVGVQIQGSFFDNALNYAAGVFNGTPDGGTIDVDTTDDEKDVAARIFAEPFRNTNLEGLKGLGIGIAGTYGNHAGSLRSFASPGQQSIFGYYAGTGTNAVTVADGTQWRLTPQAYYYWRSLGLLAEYAISSPEVRRSGGGVAGSVTEQLHHTAWQIAASYFLTGEKNSFKPVAPLHPFTLGSAGWGAWEVAGRVSQLKLDDDTFPLFADPSTSITEAISYTFGLNWYLNRNVRVALNYEHTDFDGGQNRPVTSRDENVILTRAQISF
jgi:phosphate-selective porin OprO/OprP